MSKDRVRWNIWAVRIMPKATAGAAATAKLPAQVRASGGGASESEQQLLLDCEMETGGSSAGFISIRSQSVFVCWLAHSLARECASAQAETGTEPTPAKPRAINELRIRRILK